MNPSGFYVDPELTPMLNATNNEAANNLNVLIVN